jgi:hypothetical protein
MKNLLLATIAVLITCCTYAGDILTLNNQMCFEGKVVKIKHCEVIFKASGSKFFIPAADIFSIQFESEADKVYTDYLKLINNDPDLCAKGTSDAKLYHGNGFINFAFGFLFGPFAIIATAISKPDPGLGARTYRLSENRDQFYDPAYLKCYRKEVRSNNIVKEGFGWGTFILMTLVLVKR